MKVKEVSQMLIRPGAEVKAWVEQKAAQQERSMNWIVSKILERAMQDEKQEQRA